MNTSREDKEQEALAVEASDEKREQASQLNDSQNGSIRQSATAEEEEVVVGVDS